MAEDKKSSDQTTPPDSGVAPEAGAAGPAVPPVPDPEPGPLPDPRPEPMPDPDPMPEPEPLPEPPPPEVPQPPVPPAPPPPTAQADAGSSGGFWGGIVGGVVASAIAFGAYWTLNRWQAVDLSPLNDAITDQAGRTDDLASDIVALKEEVDGLKSAPVAGDGIEARLGTLEADLSGRIDTISEEVDRLTSALSVLEGRLAQVEARPPVFAGDASEATGEVVAQMRAALEAQRQEIATLADDARARLDAVEAEARALQEKAAAESRMSAAQAARSRIAAALDAGGPFAEPLAVYAEVTGSAAPAALADHAADGVATLAELRETFPEAARAALTATAQGSVDDNAGALARIGAFLKAQTGARSLEPREGDDPDAVLSRAEAALADGRLGDTLALIGTLPEAGQAAMADWTARAEARAAAVEAVSGLAG